MKYLHFIWSNLKRKKLRTSLTILSIFVAFLLFGVLCAITAAFSAGVTMAGADRLVVRHKVSFIMNLPASYEARMRNIPGVKDVDAWTWFNGIYQDKKDNFFGSFPVDPHNLFSVHPEILLPEEQKKAWQSTRNGAIIGRQLAARMNWKIGDHIPLMSPIWPRKTDPDAPWEFEIVGIYDGAKKVTDTTGLFFRYDYFDEGRARGTGMVGWYYIIVDDVKKVDQVARAVDHEFENSPYETKTEPEGAMAQGFVEQMGSIGTILISILSAVFFTILLVAGNTMAQSVRERTEELGVLKAMGFTNELVLGLVLAESCLMAGVGGLAGLGAAWALAAKGSPVPQFLPVFFLPVKYLLIGGGLVLGLGIVAGIVPAIQAMRLQIAAAMGRHA